MLLYNDMIPINPMSAIQFVHYLGEYHAIAFERMRWASQP